MRNDVVDMIHGTINTRIEETLWGLVATKANIKDKMHIINAIYISYIYFIQLLIR